MSTNRPCDQCGESIYLDYDSPVLPYLYRNAADDALHTCRSTASTHKDEALLAAVGVLAEMGELIPAELIPAVRTGLAIAWLEGSKAGAEEAAESLQEALAQL